MVSLKRPIHSANVTNSPTLLAPKTRGGRRERERPSNASRATADARNPSPQQPDPEDDEITTSPRAARLGGPSPPKRRGRKPQGAGAPTTTASDDVASTEGPKKRKRRAAPSTSEEQPEAETERQNDPGELDDGTGRPKRRGRPPKPAQGPRTSTDDGSKGGANKRKRGATSIPKAQQHENQDGDELDDSAPAPKKRRGRPSLSEVPIEQAQNQEADLGPRKRGRPPAQSKGGQAGAPLQTNNKKGRPRKSDVPETEASPPPEPKQRGRRKKPDAAEAEPSQVNAQGDEPEPLHRPRRSDPAEAEPASGADEPPAARQPRKKPFRYLAPRERKIPISVITEKWEPLNRPSADLARKLVRQAEVPVLQSLAPGPRRDAASQILRAASGRLGKKISRGLPFPPASKASARVAARRGPGQDRGHSAAAAADGREVELDFEAVALETEALEKRLDPLLHSIEVLRVEEKRMGDVVERERKALEGLRQNSRGELALWKEKLRKSAHPLLPDKWDPDEEGGDRLALAPTREPAPAEWLFTKLPKGELPTLANQLMSHLTSIRNNVEPAGALQHAMANSEAALRRVLAGVLDSGSYEAAIMPEREKGG